MTSPIKLTFILAFLFVSSNAAKAQSDSTEIELNIFPNPSRGMFYITLVNETPQFSQLYSMDGRLVKTIYLQTGLNYVSIIEPAGIYLLKVGKEARKEYKIVIK